MSENYRIVGKRPDGTIDICRAKPEFRGKGQCKHFEHMEIPHETNLSQFINNYNERALEEELGKFDSFVADDRNFPQNVSEQKISTQKNGTVLSREELIDGAMDIANNFSSEDYAFLQSFLDDYHRRRSNSHLEHKFSNVVDNVRDFLESNKPSVVKIREFLGKDVNMDDLAEIMVFNVKAMTTAEMWGKGRKSSLTRSFLTTLNNDMTKERYIMSVLFFGGRCCYCNRPLRKSPPPSQQASGEHITPLAPEKPGEPYGGTRYGNMALACMRCNGQRKNTELVEWIQTTRCIRPENKKAVLGRIEAFRKFALFHEYSEEENKKIKQKLDELSTLEKQYKKPNSREYLDNGLEIVGKALKIAIYDLQHDSKE